MSKGAGGLAWGKRRSRGCGELELWWARSKGAQSFTALWCVVNWRSIVAEIKNKWLTSCSLGNKGSKALVLWFHGETDVKELCIHQHKRITIYTRRFLLIVVGNQVISQSINSLIYSIPDFLPNYYLHSYHINFPETPLKLEHTH